MLTSKSWIGRASQAAVAVALIAAAAFFAAPRLDSAVRGEVRTALDSYLEAAERATGLSLSFQSISPSIFETVAVRKLEVRGPAGAVLLSAGRVLVYLDLGSLAGGGLSGAIRAIRIEDAALNLDLEADKEALERIARLFSGGSGSQAVAFAISGRDISFRIAAPGTGTAYLAVREFEFAPKGEEAEFSLSGDYRIDQDLVDLGSIRGPLALSGSVAKDLSKARLELGLSARARDLDLRMQRFEAIYSGDRVELRKVRDEAPLDAEIGLDLRDGSALAELRLDGFVPERILRLSGKFAGIAPWLATAYTGSVSLALPAGDLKRLRYAARVDGSLPPGILSRPVGAAIAAKGDFERIDVERARFVDGADSLEFNGSFRFSDLSPDGTLGISYSLPGGQMPIQASVRIFGHEGEYAALAESVTVAGLAFRDLALAAAWRGKQVDFRASFLLPESAEPAPELPPLRFSGEALAYAGSAPLVSCEGSASWGASPALDLSVALESVDLGPLKGLLETALGSPDSAALLSGLRFGGEVFITSDLKRLSWTAPDLAVVSRSIPDAYALLSLSGNLDSVSVRKARISLAGVDVQGEGKLNFAPGGGIGFEMAFSLLDVPYKLRGAFAGGALTASGDYGISLYARREGSGILASISSKDMPIPIAGVHLLASVAAEGRFASAQDWSLALTSLAVVPTGEGLERIPRVSLSGSLGPKGGQLWELAVEDKFSVVSGAGRLEYALGESPSGRIVASLGSRSTPESYDIDLRYSESALTGGLSFLASPLTRIGELPISGSVDGSASIRGPLADPALTFDLKLRGGKYREQPLSARAVGAFADGAIRISDAAASYLSNRLASAAATFSLRDASAKVALSYSGIVSGDVLSFALDAEGGSLAKEGAGLAERLAAYSAKGAFDGFKFGAIAVKLLPFTANFSGSGARLTAGAQGELSVSYGRDGSFELQTRRPLPVRLSASGTLKGNAIEAEARGVELDLPFFSPFLFAPRDLQLLTGTATGSFRARGLLADPEINGRLDAKGVTLRVPGWIADMIGPFDLPVMAEGRSFSAYAPSVPVGKAAISLRGQAALDHWAPSGLKGTLRNIEGAQVKLDASLLGISVAGDAGVELTAELRGDTVFLDGDLALGKASVLVSPEVWARKAAEQGPAEQSKLFLSVNIDVTLGRGARVVFPSKELPIVSGYADRGSALKIRYDQATNDLLLKGAVALRGGDVYYIQRNFFLKSARLAFNETIDRFDPRVTVLAELRDRNDEGPVLITLSANNVPIASFQPNLSSEPAMSETQIAALLGQNLLGMEGNSEFDIVKAGISGLEFIPQLNVTKVFESRIRESLGLDILYLKTQVLQRFIIDYADSATAAAASKFPLARYLDESALYAGKYLGDAVFIHGSARLREDPLVRSSGLSLDSELGAEFDTPFGLVQWTVTPSSPESLFISDQSISVSWKLSY
jgi:translocation and assembly module TamB